MLDPSDDSISHERRQPPNQAHKTISRCRELAAARQRRQLSPRLHSPPTPPDPHLRQGQPSFVKPLAFRVLIEGNLARIPSIGPPQCDPYSGVFDLRSGWVCDNLDRELGAVAAFCGPPRRGQDRDFMRPDDLPGNFVRQEPGREQCSLSARWKVPQRSPELTPRAKQPFWSVGGLLRLDHE